jgi:hypothetical protein
VCQCLRKAQSAKLKFFNLKLGEVMILSIYFVYALSVLLFSYIVHWEFVLWNERKGESTSDLLRLSLNIDNRQKYQRPYNAIKSKKYKRTKEKSNYSLFAVFLFATHYSLLVFDIDNF